MGAIISTCRLEPFWRPCPALILCEVFAVSLEHGVDLTQIELDGVTQWRARHGGGRRDGSSHGGHGVLCLVKDGVARGAGSRGQGVFFFVVAITGVLWWR